MVRRRWRCDETMSLMWRRRQKKRSREREATTAFSLLARRIQTRESTSESLTLTHSRSRTRTLSPAMTQASCRIEFSELQFEPEVEGNAHGGAFGEIRFARLRGQDVAVKRIRRQMTERELQKVGIEVELLTYVWRRSPWRWQWCGRVADGGTSRTRQATAPSAREPLHGRVLRRPGPLADHRRAPEGGHGGRAAPHPHQPLPAPPGARGPGGDPHRAAVVGTNDVGARCCQGPQLAPSQPVARHPSRHQARQHAGTLARHRHLRSYNASWLMHAVVPARECSLITTAA